MNMNFKKDIIIFLRDEGITDDRKIGSYINSLEDEITRFEARKFISRLIENKRNKEGYLTQLDWTDDDGMEYVWIGRYS
jgi:hypothetical protein